MILFRKPVPTPDHVPDASGAGFFGIMLYSAVSAAEE
jgi:hypothetical protein